MDRQRVDRPGSDRFGDGGRRVQSRWSSGSPTHQPNRYGPRGGNSGGDDEFAGGGGGGRYHPYRAPHDFPPPPVGAGGGGGGFGKASGGGGGGGFRGGGSAGDFAPPMPMGGPRRGFGGRGSSPERGDFNKFAKLFIGSVPRTATEEDIRPLFEEHGDVIEVAFIKDRKTGEQQGCCFVKYATSEEADRAIRALHNQYTLPGGLGPIQVRYADGDREHHGAVEDKLFVASLNKQATAKEIEEIFLPYGHVEDVYIMKDSSRQSRGCGFVKFSNREMATAALNALNGKYVMRGCDQPLVVRFADPKRPRVGGESRGGPAFGGPGFSPRSEAALVIRPTANLDESINGRKPSDAWHPLSPESLGPSSQFSAQGPGNQLTNRGVGSVETSSEISGMFGPTGGSSNGSIPNLSMAPASLQGLNSLIAPVRPYTSQQISQLQKPLMPFQNFPSLNLPNAQQTPSTSSQIVNLQAPLQQSGQVQVPQSGGLPSFNQALTSLQLSGMVGQVSATQALLQQNVSSSAMQTPINLQSQAVSAIPNQQSFALSNVPNQLLQQPMQQFPSHSLLQQQAQALQSRAQSSQQAIYQLQQHLQLMQQQMQQQQMTQVAKPQSAWIGHQSTPVISASTSPSTPATVMVSTTSATTSLTVNTSPAVPLTCNWTEHTSPEGFKYYYNSVTHESKWEKPDEFALYEQQQKLLLLQQQQQQQKFAVQQLPSASDAQQHALIQPNQQGSQIQQVQQQTVRQQAQLQLQPALMFQASGAIPHQNLQDFNYRQLQVAGSVIDPARIQQGIQAAQELAWKSKPAGS